MPPKGTAAVKAKVTRLPPLPHLRVKTPNIANARPCNTVMASVLSKRIPSIVEKHIWVEEIREQEGEKRGPEDKRIGADEIIDCWASSGYSVEGCASLETALRTCMDAPVRTVTTYLHFLEAVEEIRMGGWIWKDGRMGAQANAINRDRQTSRRIPSTTTCRECTHRWLDRTRGSRRAACMTRRRCTNRELYQKHKLYTKCREGRHVRL